MHLKGLGLNSDRIKVYLRHTCNVLYCQCIHKRHVFCCAGGEKGPPESSSTAAKGGGGGEEAAAGGAGQEGHGGRDSSGGGRDSRHICQVRSDNLQGYIMLKKLPTA